MPHDSDQESPQIEVPKMKRVRVEKGGAGSDGTKSESAGLNVSKKEIEAKLSSLKNIDPWIHEKFLQMTGEVSSLRKEVGCLKYESSFLKDDKRTLQIELTEKKAENSRQSESNKMELVLNSFLRGAAEKLSELSVNKSKILHKKCKKLEGEVRVLYEKVDIIESFLSQRKILYISGLFPGGAEDIVVDCSKEASKNDLPEFMQNLVKYKNLLEYKYSLCKKQVENFVASLSSNLPILRFDDKAAKVIKEIIADSDEELRKTNIFTEKCIEIIKKVRKEFKPEVPAKRKLPPVPPFFKERKGGNPDGTSSVPSATRK